MGSFYVTCDECQHSWIAQFHTDHGLMFSVDEHGESCPECGSNAVEVGDEYTSPMKISSMWVVLLIPNVLLFWS